jgi:hypothetical protein
MLSVKVDEEIDRFEKDRILGIVLLHVFRCIHCDLHYLLERLANDIADMTIPYVALVYTIPGRRSFGG